jgi:hypothetical protein
MPLAKPKKILIQEKLEHSILYGLAYEWENALSILSPFDREKMRKPLFSIRDMTDRWGYWSEEKNEIAVSRNLVLNHSWDAVREILLHEMAHQFAGQVLGARNEPPHGPKFKRACYLLVADPKASGNYKPLDELISQDSASAEDKILLRVKKLMALAQSRNIHEAEAAMAKAHELIAKYNLDLLTRHERRKFVSVFVGRPALRHFREDYHLSRLIQDFYFVYGIWVSAYVVEKGKMGRVLEISGTLQNLKIAKYVYDFVKHFIDSQWDIYNQKKGLNRYRKTDFALGVIEGFSLKLRLQAQKQNKQQHNITTNLALTKTRDPLLQEHIDYRYPYISKVRGKILREDKHVMQDGICLGKRLIIYQGITEKGTSRKLLN